VRSNNSEQASKQAHDADMQHATPDAHCLPPKSPLVEREGGSPQWTLLVSTVPADFALVLRQSSHHRSVGLHPWFLHNQDASAVAATLEYMNALLAANPGLGVGEIGLDKHAQTPAAVQRQVFSAQLQLAATHRRCVSVHCVRSSDALLQVLSQLNASEALPSAIYLHAHSASEQATRQLLALERVAPLLYFGACARLNDNAKCAHLYGHCLPRDHLLVESDEPLDSPSRQQALQRALELTGLTPEQALRNFCAMLGLRERGPAPGCASEREYV
jgi:Tat protein secretion system quality control protein TatD with DNase activity